MRSIASHALLVSMALSICRVGSLNAQTSLFDRWLTDFVTRSSRPAWMNLGVPVTTDAGGRPHQFLIGTRAEVLSLGRSGRLSQHYTTIRTRQQLGRSLHALRVGVTHDGRSVRTAADDPLLTSTASPVLDLGVELGWTETLLGDWTVLGVATADRGVSGSVAVSNRSPFHSLSITGWRVNARSLMLTVPTDSVTDVAEEHVVDGGLAAGSILLPIGPVRLVTDLSYEKSKAMSEPVEREAFLTMSPNGSLDIVRFRLGVALRDGVGVAGRWSRHNIELTAPFMRGGQQAGKLFFGRLNLRQWSAEVWRATSSSHWSLQLGTERLDGAVSARLETWPFVALWEQLGATAFRYRGTLAGDVLWFRFQRRRIKRNPSGFTWAVNVARYRLDSSQRDWLVTSFGFGRAEDDYVTTTVSPVIMLGGELARPFSVASGQLHVFLAADLPVYGKTEHSHESSGLRSDAGGLAGQFRLGVHWVW